MTFPYRMNMFQRDQVAVAPHKIPRSTDGRPKVVFLFFHHQPIVRTDGRTKVVFRAWYMVHGAWCMVHGAWCMMHGAWCMVRWTALHSPVTPCQMSHFRALWIALWSMLYDLCSMIYDLWSMIYDLWPMINDLWSMIYALKLETCPRFGEWLHNWRPSRNEA
jgi:hypothetical protein